MKRHLPRLVATIACVPLAALLTLVALPLWRWIEARTGIESIGHSGPADWCWLATFAACLAAALAGTRRCRSGDAA